MGCGGGRYVTRAPGGNPAPAGLRSADGRLLGSGDLPPLPLVALGTLGDPTGARPYFYAFPRILFAARFG